eukprot:gene6509-10517_t
MSFIVDNGSGFIRSGLSSSTSPSCIFPSVISKEKLKGITMTERGLQSEQLHFGENAFLKKSLYQISHPIQHRKIKNFDNLEKLWEHAAKESKIDFQNHNFLCSVGPQLSDSDLEKITQITMEKFEIPSLNISTTSKMALFSMGLTTGIIVDSGYGGNDISSFEEGKKTNTKMLDYLFGHDLTQQFFNIYSQQVIFKYEDAIYEIEKIKEKFGYVSLDMTKEKVEDELYTLPDGNKLTISKERFLCAEGFFDGTFVGNSDNLQSIIIDLIEDSEREYQKEMYSNIVLSGGNTVWKNFDQRLKIEISKLSKSKVCNIFSSIDNDTSVFKGYVAFSSLDSFKNYCMTSEEYDEHGPLGIHKKQ